MAHIHEEVDFMVNVFITHSDKVLLIHHKKLNRWLAIGGHIELNEDTDQALFREVQEECGLEIEVLNEKPTIEAQDTKFLYTPSFLDIHKISDTHKHIGLVYFAKTKSDKFIHNKEEHNDIRWFSREDLEKAEFNINNAVKFYANKALNSSKI